MTLKWNDEFEPAEGATPLNTHSVYIWTKRGRGSVHVYGDVTYLWGRDKLFFKKWANHRRLKSCYWLTGVWANHSQPSCFLLVCPKTNTQWRSHGSDWQVDGFYRNTHFPHTPLNREVHSLNTLWHHTVLWPLLSEREEGGGQINGQAT